MKVQKQWNLIKKSKSSSKKREFVNHIDFQDEQNVFFLFSSYQSCVILRSWMKEKSSQFYSSREFSLFLNKKTPIFILWSKKKSNFNSSQSSLKKEQLWISSIFWRLIVFLKTVLEKPWWIPYFFLNKMSFILGKNLIFENE